MITRAGDEALRSVLVVGATAVIRHAQRSQARVSPWLIALLKLVAVALANKIRPDRLEADGIRRALRGAG